MQRCPECEGDLDELQEYELDVGETINCPMCFIELKVLSAEPLSLAVPEEE